MVNQEDTKQKLKPFEMSELLLFEALAWERKGEHYKAVNTILKKDKQVTNLIAKYEILARNYETLGKNDKAIDALHSLLQIQSANADYYWRILKLKGVPKPANSTDSSITDTEREAGLKLLEQY